jgi:hypothetical protein
MIPMMVVSCLMGLLFGTIFGIEDIEDINFRQFRDKWMQEEFHCIPIGIICGAMSGLYASLIDNNVKHIRIFIL